MAEVVVEQDTGAETDAEPLGLEGSPTGLTETAPTNGVSAPSMETAYTAPSVEAPASSEGQIADPLPVAADYEAASGEDTPYEGADVDEDVLGVLGGAELDIPLNAN